MDLCVIEDHPVNLSVLKGVSSSVPVWRVEGFRDPLAALDRCLQAVFDSVLVDYQMPSMDGIEVIRRLRADLRFEHVPIVMITADQERALRLSAIRAGATDFLNKPVDPEELRVRAANLLALRRGQRALADRARPRALARAQAGARPGGRCPQRTAPHDRQLGPSRLSTP